MVADMLYCQPTVNPDGTPIIITNETIDMSIDMRTFEMSSRRGAFIALFFVGLAMIGSAWGLFKTYKFEKELRECVQWDETDQHSTLEGSELQAQVCASHTAKKAAQAAGGTGSGNSRDDGAGQRP